MIPFKRLLVLKKYRKFIGRIRLFYFWKILHRLKTIDSEFSFDVTVKHNLKSLWAFGGTRMNSIIRILSVIETLNSNSKILIIGPRNESDILGLMGLGFRNIRGLDLITYSPLIDLGDMHELPYDENFYDVVICGWTISYSNTPGKFAEECMRVINDKGIVAIGLEYASITSAELKDTIGYQIAPGDFQRVNSTAQILNLFDGHVKHVFYNHDAPAKRSHQHKKLIKHPSSVVTVFSVNK